jgi:hypothetical protein
MTLPSSHQLLSRIANAATHRRTVFPKHPLQIRPDGLRNPFRACRVGMNSIGAVQLWVECDPSEEKRNERNAIPLRKRPEYAVECERVVQTV